MNSFLFFYFFICTSNASLEIVAGQYHNCVYEPGQTGMTCWGLNDRGQLGYEDTNNRGDDAGEMSANLSIVDLGPNFIVNTTGLGAYHSCAASQEHAVKCWGWGAYYQTGHATNNDLGGGAGEMGVNLAFVEFPAEFVPLKVAGGDKHSCVLSIATGALLVCFGHNPKGQCGAGTSDTYIIGPPSNIAVVELGSNFTPIDIALLSRHTCAISQQQTIKCFGGNAYGQLGYGDTTNRGTTPESMGDGLLVVSLGSNFTPKAVATGDGHTCALSTLKTVKCFGRNSNGQCGQVTPGGNIGDAANEMDDNLPVIVFPDDFVPMQMALGYWHTCILSESGQVMCFGENSSGQLGLGHTSSTTSPTLVDLGTDFIPRKITAGKHHTCAVSTIDTVKCWGNNDYGQLGLGHVNNTGDAPNEMGDDLQVVDVCWGVCTKAPTTASPTTASPTTAAPTTVATLPDELYNVTIASDELQCQEIEDVIVPAVHAATAIPIIINVTTECDGNETIPVELLVAVPAGASLNNETTIVILFVQVIYEVYEVIEVDIIVNRIISPQPTDSEEPPLLSIEWWIVIGAVSGLCLLIVVITSVLRKQPSVVNNNNVTINADNYNDNRGAQITMVGTAAVDAQT